MAPRGNSMSAQVVRASNMLNLIIMGLRGLMDSMLGEAAFNSVRSVKELLGLALK